MVKVQNVLSTDSLCLV